MITMLLGGLWHGAAWRFILWGGIHGAALCVHKGAMRLFPAAFPAEGKKMHPWRRILGILVTFHLVCFAWIFFRAQDMTIVGQVLRQIFTNFNVTLIPNVIAGYTGVFALILVGYVLHFSPSMWARRVNGVVTRMPLVAKALMIAVLIWFVMQIKSADIQPFIYFQF